MPDIGGGNAMACQQFRLKGKDAQHMVGTATNLPHALGPPGPDRRANKVHGLDTGGTQVFLQLEVEVGCIGANKDVGALLEQAFAQLVAYANNLAVAAQQFPVETMDCQLLERPPNAKAQALHLRSANAKAGQCRPTLFQTAQQQPGQQVTGDFARHHGN